LIYLKAQCLKIENITVGNNSINQIDVINTLKKLGVYEEILMLPDGLDTKVMPGGIGVSKELCAQINIARNILRKPRLWIVHGHNYSAVIHALQAFGNSLPKPTIIAVGSNALAHKTSDIIYLLADGNIVAKGPYSELQNNTTYKNLIQL
jgi:ABC-type multidrug transport system fused ATPase/permease subunit